MFRDPFVWKVKEGWRMVVGAGYGDGRSAIRLYASADLHEWVRLDDLASLPRQEGDGPETGDAWECPQILDLAGHSIAIVGTWSQVRGVNSVLSFVVEEPTRVSVVDHGTNFYAASALRDSRFGPLIFGWVTEGREEVRWRRSWLGRSTFAAAAGVAGRRQHCPVGAGADRPRTTGRYGSTGGRRRSRRPVRDRRAHRPCPRAPALRRGGTSRHRPPSRRRTA